MKYLFLILISLNAYSENWMPHSKIANGSKEAHQLKKSCERISGEKCYDIGDTLPSSVYSEADILVDDSEKPIYSKNQIEPCTDDCQSKLEALICIDIEESAIKTLNEVYCSKFLSYEQKIEKTIVLDSAKKAAHDINQAQKVQIAQLEAGISYAKSAMECGKRVMALMLVRNQPKGLSKTQVKQLVKTYADIKNLLESASLASAKEEISLVVEDGVLVTTADKDALMAEIDKCLGQ